MYNSTIGVSSCFDRIKCVKLKWCNDCCQKCASVEEIINAFQNAMLVLKHCKEPYWNIISIRIIDISKATINYHNVGIQTNACIQNLHFKTYCPVIKIYI